MASNTTPPVDDQIPSLYLSDTFYTWFNNTNDLINKVNPIELYSITADTTGYLSSIQKDGITIDNLGNGNFKIGYILPTEITGGHTFTQHVRFLNGVSGDIVNFVNGRTGSAQAVTTISGNAITSTVDGVANVESVVFTINGVAASTAGAMTLDATDIPNTVAGTGPEGTILAATGGGSGAYSRKVEMFTALPDEEQIAIRVRGTTGGVGGRSPHVCFGYSSTRGVCADYLFWLNAENADGNDGSTLGGMLISGQHTLNNSPYDIVSDSRLYAGGNDGIEITSKMDHSSSDNFHVKFSSNQSGSGVKNKIGDNTAHTVIYDSGTPEYAGMSLGVNAEGLLTSGLDIRGKVYDKNGAAAGATGSILTSTSGSKVEWILPSATHINDGSQTGLTLPTGTGQASAAGGFPISSNEGTPMRFTATGLSTSNGNESSWDDRLVMVFMTLLGTDNSGDNFPILEIYHDTSTSTSAPTFTTDHKNAFLQRGDGAGMAYGTTTYTIAYRQPAGGSIWWKYSSIGTSDNANLALVGYSVVVI